MNKSSLSSKQVKKNFSPFTRGLFTFILLISLVLTSPFCAVAAEASQNKSGTDKQLPPGTSILTQKPDALVNMPVISGFTYNQLELSSVYVLIRQVTPYGRFDYLRGLSDKPLHAGSITQFMTYYVCQTFFRQNNISLDKKIKITVEDLAKAEKNQANIVGLRPDEEYTIRDLYHAMLLGAGADAIYALVREAGSSEEGFVQSMNVYAKKLGMQNTTFSNPVGFGDDKVYTTCDDLAILMEELAKDSFFLETLSARTYKMSPTASKPDGITLQSIMEKYANDRNLDTKALTAGKTGSSDESDYCFASFAKEGDSTYLIITAKAKEAGLEVADHLHLLSRMKEIPFSFPLLAKDQLVTSVPLGKDETNLIAGQFQPLMIQEGCQVTQPLFNDMGKFHLENKTPAYLPIPVEAKQEVGDLVIWTRKDNKREEIFQTKLKVPDHPVEIKENLPSPSPLSTQDPGSQKQTEISPTAAAAPVTKEPKPAFPWGKTIGGIILLAGLLFVVYRLVRSRQEKKRLARRKRLRELQNSYAYYDPETMRAEDLLKRSRDKHDSLKKSRKPDGSDSSR